MKNGKSFAIIGGDLRQIKMANGLAKDGYGVKIFGFSDIEFHKDIIQANNIQEAVSGVDVIVAPLPCSLDNETVNAPFYNERIYFNDLFKQMLRNQLFVGGKISEKINNLAKVYNIYVIDYFEREELTVLNAIPTAEGAIQIAMEELPITLHNSNCLVLGFGRIGKILSKMLVGIGANVTVEARKYEDLAWIKSYGYTGVHLNKLGEIIGNYDVIFNTIPSVILNTEILSKIKKDCLVIDLASKPGGVDFDMARDMGIKTIWALSLPGKVAPDTAGDIIKDTIFNIIDELGV
ncbi:MAG: dipicolinate synthase subunit [Petroclostridium sp.]|jgi:dipicolinate synthase subunit A|uniref:dipicolinate synthase subunit DpsA n=1 Tax=Petroclostridium xylanilyticum TaxID=1792311 RepID=UPI000B99086E|nr:dipicolinate synthase subunit DpsA [Petroclostridium xylanilyticum]MBZ4646377.1 glutamyl-tRNA reductase [Clostridia bacterium]MDK2810178.1 dipicolinate synthase subunit [Petroclostridium sp.]